MIVCKGLAEIIRIDPTAGERRSGVRNVIPLLYPGRRGDDELIPLIEIGIQAHILRVRIDRRERDTPFRVSKPGKDLPLYPGDGFDALAAEADDKHPPMGIRFRPVGLVLPVQRPLRRVRVPRACELQQDPILCSIDPHLPESLLFSTDCPIRQMHTRSMDPLYTQERGNCSLPRIRLPSFSSEHDPVQNQVSVLFEAVL